MRPAPEQQQKVWTFDLPLASPPRVDILFVIDDSPAMRDHEANLVANFGRFVDVLGTISGGLPDLHIGVMTSDLGTRGASDSHSTASVGGCVGDGDNGALRHTPGVEGAFITDRPTYAGAREVNYTSSLADRFAELASVGSHGCAFAQPLEAVRTALDHHPANAGFLREDANLAIVFISAQDDCTFEHSSFVTGDSAADVFRCTSNGITCSDPNTCSPRSDSPTMPDVTRYASFLRGLKADPADVMIGVVAGPPTPVMTHADPMGATVLDPSCTFEASAATPAVRLAALAESFPSRERVTSICQADLTDGLVLSSCVVGIGGRGFSGKLVCMDVDLIDLDPETAGVQAECTVSDVQHPTAADRRERVLARCDATASNLPCWHMISDEPQCGHYTRQNLAMSIERADFPAGDTHLVVACAAE
ncbi:MAG: hypothetical protein JWO36_2953 [Myxococcales bacterium]|nr:hypothetical protein [Myxococcales bacterium]